MAKGKSTAYFCSDCGYESAKWTGQCPACKSWNTMVEEPVSQIKTVGKGGTGSCRKVSADTGQACHAVGDCAGRGGSDTDRL